MTGKVEKLNSGLLARKVQVNRIVHNDLELGPSSVEQRRGPNEYSEEKQLELVLIFRDIEEVKFLDLSRYTRIAMHVDGEPLREYWYDEACELEADDFEVIKPHVSDHRGRWVLVGHIDYTARKMIEELKQQLCQIQSN